MSGGSGDTGEATRPAMERAAAESRGPGVVFIGAVAASNADVAPDRGRWRRGPRAVLSSFPLVGPAARENDGILAVCLVEESIRIERFYSSF